MTMEYRILGPLEVIGRDGTAVRIRAGHARTVLAMLVANANRKVSSARLIEAAWNGEPTPTARSALQTMVSVLRKTLRGASAAGTESILSVDGGYMLQARPDEIDLLRTRELAARARRQRDQGALLEAESSFQSALALWRGQPFEGIQSAALEAEALQLGMERVAILADKADTELAVGRAGETAAWLPAFVAEYPLNEDLRYLEMLALHRAGRRADALNSYRDARRILADELGLEPSQRLQQLHHGILANDPALDGASSATLPAEPTPMPPAQLPPDLVDFTGRIAEGRRLLEWLSQPHLESAATRIGVITGAGGIGKTVLAVHAAHQLREQYPDGQPYADLGGAGPTAASATTVLARFLADLGANPARIPADESRLAESYRSRTADRRILVILDDAGQLAQVRPLLPSGRGCGVIITSRHMLTGLAGICRVPLDTFTAPESLSLFSHIAGRDRVNAESDAAERLLGTCGGLPLAVRVAGERLSSRVRWTVGYLASRLADEVGRLDELAAGDLAVRACLDASYLDIPAATRPQQPDVARLFRLLGLAPGPDISIPAAAALIGAPWDATEYALESLVDIHLLRSPEPGRYQLHDLASLFAAERSAVEDPAAESHQAIRSLIDWYGHTLDVATRLMTPGRKPVIPFALPSIPSDGIPLAFRTPAEAAAWCETERDNLEAIVPAADGYGMRRTAWQIALTLHSQMVCPCSTCTMSRLLTPGRSASSSSVQPRTARSDRTLPAIARVTSSSVPTRTPLPEFT